MDTITCAYEVGMPDRLLDFPANANGASAVCSIRWPGLSRQSMIVPIWLDG